MDRAPEAGAGMGVVVPDFGRARAGRGAAEDEAEVGAELVEEAVGHLGETNELSQFDRIWRVGGAIADCILPNRMASTSRCERFTMAINKEKIDDAALALLYLTLHDDYRAWKGFDWDVLGRLHDKGMIHDPVGKVKSVVFTQEGLERAKTLFETMFKT